MAIGQHCTQTRVTFERISRIFRKWKASEGHLKPISRVIAPDSRPLPIFFFFFFFFLFPFSSAEAASVRISSLKLRRIASPRPVQVASFS